MPMADNDFLLDAFMRITGCLGCTDTNCYNGIQAQLARPARHFVHQRIREVTELGETPQSVPAKATSTILSEGSRTMSQRQRESTAFRTNYKKKFANKNDSIWTLRRAFTNLAEIDLLVSVVKVPARLEPRRRIARN